MVVSSGDSNGGRGATWTGLGVFFGERAGLMTVGYSRPRVAAIRTVTCTLSLISVAIA